MAINNIPGVGPANTDVATAVAAAVPTLGQINTAVNTQTNNSAIATAVAAAVPNSTQITSIVQANAGGFAGQATLLATQNANSAATTTLSWSGTYKQIIVIGTNGFGWNGTGQTLIAPNNDTTSGNYSNIIKAYQQTTQYANTVSNGYSYGAGYWIGSITNTNNSYFECIFDYANSSAPKMVRSQAYNGTAPLHWESWGVWNNTAAITSITVRTNGAAIFTSGQIRVIGVN